MSSDFNWLERRFLPFVVLAPLMGVVFTYTELQYLAFGEMTDGQIALVEEIEEPRGQGTAVVAHRVQVEFVDSSTNETEQFVAHVGSIWKPEADTVDVQYIPDRTGTGRLASDQHPWIAVSIVVGTILLTLAAIKFGMEANLPVSRRR